MRLELMMTLLLMGCQTLSQAPQQELKPGTSYRRDLAMDINGEALRGFGVPTRSLSYHITVRPQAPTNLVRLTSCHRDLVQEAPSGGSKQFSFIYQPVEGLENGRSCPIEVTALATTGQHSFGFVDFELEDHGIGGTLECNGARWAIASTSVCESREGLEQQLTFEKIVRVSPDAGCPLETKDNLTFRYPSPKRECIYFFCDKSGACHKHTALGYEQLTAGGAL